MDNITQNVQDRVREYTPEESKNIDKYAVKNLQKYRSPTKDEINQRLEELRNEWDVERFLEVNAASLALAGVILGTVFSKKWYLLSAAVSGFLLQHGVQGGWKLPLPVLRFLRIRTRQEIDEEINALKVLRGDFDSINAESQPEDILETLRG